MEASKVVRCSGGVHLSRHQDFRIHITATPANCSTIAAHDVSVLDTCPIESLGEARSNAFDPVHLGGKLGPRRCECLPRTMPTTRRRTSNAQFPRKGRSCNTVRTRNPDPKAAGPSDTKTFKPYMPTSTACSWYHIAQIVIELVRVLDRSSRTVWIRS